MKTQLKEDGKISSGSLCLEQKPLEEERRIWRGLNP